MRDFIKIKEQKKGKNKNLLIDVNKYLTIDDAKELSAEILKHIAKVTSVTFNMQKMENIDVSGLQVFYATQKKAEELGIPFTYELKGQEDVVNILLLSGFEQVVINNKK